MLQGVFSLCEMPYTVIYHQESTFSTSLCQRAEGDIQRGDKKEKEKKFEVGNGRGIRSKRVKVF